MAKTPIEAQGAKASIRKLAGKTAHCYLVASTSGGEKHLDYLAENSEISEYSHDVLLSVAEILPHSSVDQFTLAERLADEGIAIGVFCSNVQKSSSDLALCLEKLSARLRKSRNSKLPQGSLHINNCFLSFHERDSLKLNKPVEMRSVIDKNKGELHQERINLAHERIAELQKEFPDIDLARESLRAFSKEYFGSSAAAQKLGLSTSRLSHLANTGEIGFQIAPRTKVFTKKEIAAFKLLNRTPGRHRKKT